MSRQDNKTFRIAFQELALIGVSLQKIQNNPAEYRVNFKGGAESTAYYTYDLRDALATGRDMAKRAGSSPLRVAVNLPAQLASAGFVQNLRKSTVNFTWWERDNASAITSGNGYLLWVGENSMGGSTPTHLAEHLKALEPSPPKETMHELAVEAAGRALINVQQGQGINYPKPAVVVAAIWEIDHTLRNKGYAMGALTSKNVVEEIVAGFLTHGDKYLIQAALKIHNNMRALTDLELRAER